MMMLDRFMCTETDNTLYNLSVDIENYLEKFNVIVRPANAGGAVEESMRRWYSTIYNSIDNRLTSNESGMPTPVDPDARHFHYLECK